ncbi:MAG: M28 family metallopeptidase [Bacteroidia bacterium]
MSATNLKSPRYSRLCLLAGLLSWFSSSGQELSYARKQLDTLSSNAFFGRGYSHGGQQLAAEYLLREFSRLGLEPLSDNYLHPFSLDINSIDSCYLAINKKVLEPGRDYLVHPNSGEGRGKLQKPAKALCISSLRESPKIGNHTQLLLETGHEKLTWSVGRDSWPLPIFQLREGVLPTQIKSLDFVVQNTFKSHLLANVAGLIRGKTYPDAVIIISAHYDHLGMMGNTIFPGANDNASGTAMLLDMARHYTQVENQPHYSLLFIAFGAEEAGLVGSSYYVNNPLWPLEKTSFVLNLDLMAGGSEGIMVVNGEQELSAWMQLDSLNRAHELLTAVKKRGNAANSDHYPFTQEAVPAIFVYTLGDVKAYHDPFDRAELLDLKHYDKTFRLLQLFIDQFQSQDTHGKR